jgi:hypothetical protein
MNNDEIKLRSGRIEEEMKRMFELIKHNGPQKINEASLSRIWHWTQKHDTAIITASRVKNENCVEITEGEEKDQIFTKEENKERNKDLYAVLIEKKYGVTKVNGNYIENFQTSNATEVSEVAFFVVNVRDDKNFFETIINLGKFYCQDSVLLIPMVDEGPYLYGTNYATYPGLDNKSYVGKFKGGREGEFLTRVGKGNRPFVFEDITTAECFNNSGRYLMSKRVRELRKYMKNI